MLLASARRTAYIHGELVGIVHSLLPTSQHASSRISQSASKQQPVAVDVHCHRAPQGSHQPALPEQPPERQELAHARAKTASDAHLWQAWVWKGNTVSQDRQQIQRQHAVDGGSLATAYFGKVSSTMKSTTSLLINMSFSGRKLVN